MMKKIREPGNQRHPDHLISYHNSREFHTIDI
jgi:hypothetical protein